MIVEFLRFGSAQYFGYLGLVLFARAMDFFSTWIATPNLVLEGNPIAKFFGWRGGLVVNAIIAALIAAWPPAAIVLIVMSVLVAARNFQSAWMMRSMGEINYAIWIHERLATTPRGLFVLCVLAQSFLTGLVGAAIMYYTPVDSIAYSIGAGIVSYGSAVLAFSLFSLWRFRRG
jgi:hypothetical protein